MDRYYDLVLALIPTALLGLGGSLFFAGLGFQIAVSIAGLAAVALVGHALFVNGPVGDAAPTSSDTSPSDSAVGPVNAD